MQAQFNSSSRCPRCGGPLYHDSDPVVPALWCRHCGKGLFLLRDGTPYLAPPLSKKERIKNGDEVRGDFGRFAKEADR